MPFDLVWANQLSLSWLNLFTYLGRIPFDVYCRFSLLSRSEKIIQAPLICILRICVLQTPANMCIRSQSQRRGS